MNTEPRRLLEGEELGAALRTDLERAAAHDVGYDVSAGAIRFEAALAGGGPLPGGGGATVTATSTGKVLAALGVALVLGGGAIAWSISGGDPDAPADEPRALVVAPETRAVVVEPPEAEVEPEQVEALVEPTIQVPAEAEAEPNPRLPTRAGRPSAEPRAKTKSSGSASDDSLRREMLATDRARRALASDPGRALRLVKQADREFGEGLFGEDREGIEILALFGLGRDGQAQRRAAAFLKVHPRSSHADQIREASKASD